MKVLAALNAFKESPDKVVALNEAIAGVLSKVGHEVKVFPIADGGDGTIDTFIHHAKAQGGKEITHEVTGPLGEKVQARWLHLPNAETNTAIIEMAQASGLNLVPVDKRDPLVTSSYGTGELVKKALEKEAKNILLTIGGSATVDGGMGMLQALGAEFRDTSGKSLPAGGASLENVVSIDLTKVKEALGDAKLIFLCDVLTPFIARSPSEHGVLLYAPQKFPDKDHPPPVPMATLQRGVENFAKVVDAMLKPNASLEDSTGAAGGLAYIPVAALGAQVTAGFEHLSQMFKLEEQVKETDVVITGEGRLDESTLEGKAPIELIRLAQKHKKPVVFICGSAQKQTASGQNIDWKRHGIDLVIEIKPEAMPLPEAIQQTKSLIENNVRGRASEIEALHSRK